MDDKFIYGMIGGLILCSIDIGMLYITCIPLGIVIGGIMCYSSYNEREEDFYVK